MAIGMAEELTAGTLDGLEIRLKRLEYLITGNSSLSAAETGHQASRAVSTRLQSLETSLQDLSSKSSTVREFLDLYQSHPDLFPPPGALPPSNSFTTREQFAAVKASAISFSTTASQLNSIQDSPVPSAESSASLVALQPRLAAAKQKHASQNRQIAQLRLKSAQLLERWYDVSVIGGNECWAEWDHRLTQAERTLRQEEARREKEKEPI